LEEDKMKLKTPIFSIPIYFCSEDGFHKRIEKEKTEFEEMQKDKYVFKKYRIKQPFRYMRDEWKYNKIIGWIELYLQGTMLKADYWFIDSKRIFFRFKTKNFVFIGKIDDVSDMTHKDNKQIVEDIRTFLDKCQQGEYIERFSKYYIYTGELYLFLEFCQIGQILDNMKRTNKREL
jgi:hypothetical protein